MQRGTRIAAVAAFLVLVFIAVPMAIAAAHRTDLYYTLSSVALLSIASGGVWLTFYIGRINIGQGAFALVGGYVSAILVRPMASRSGSACRSQGCSARRPASSSVCRS